MTLCVERAEAAAQPAASIGDGLRRLEADEFDLVVWGVGADEPGWTDGVARLHEASGVPLILLDESYEDARAAFEAGADQLLPKPFVPGALVGAVKAGLRAAGPSSVVAVATRIEFADAVFDSEERAVKSRRGAAMLSRREWELLSFLLTNPNQWFDAEPLARQSWRSGRHSPEQLRSYVARLRRKMAPLQLPCDILSRRGRGYCLKLEVDSTSSDGRLNRVTI
jgi:DNA-binding response OmpR family regulator